MTETPRDRLRELLDAVLDEGNQTLQQMAGDAYASPFHFNRLLSGAAYEAPVAPGAGRPKERIHDQAHLLHRDHAGRLPRRPR